MNEALYYFSHLFNIEAFPPRWLCGQWNHFTGWFYILSDIGIGAAYYTIPFLIAQFIRKRTDIPFPRVFWLFAAFIFACGTTHFMDATLFWWPAYRLAGVILFVTALVSWRTIFAMIPTIPQALMLKSPKDLERMVEERTHQLQESEERFRLLVENVKDYSIYFVDIHGNISSWNAGAENLFGYTAEETLGKPLETFLPPPLIEESLPQKELGVAATKGRFETEGFRFRKDGSQFWASILLTALYNEKKELIGFSNITRDITERKHAMQALKESKESAEDANRKKSQFLANMSHELRTPLNAVIGYSQMMDKGVSGELSDKQKKYAHNIYVSGRHLLDMVNDLLDIAKIEAGRINLDLDKVSVSSLIEELKDVFFPMAEEKDVSLTFEVGPDLTQVISDPARLKQIFINLISNAIKFNKPNGNVIVRLYQEESNGKFWFVGQVEDTGIGIPQDKIGNLFTEFYQIDSTASRKYEGTGLGLALTKHLVELHRGTITVTSEEGVGSCFTFRFPNIFSADAYRQRGNEALQQGKQV